jgi:pimeloyl-ACP methyl ester carboxylesterase
VSIAVVRLPAGDPARKIGSLFFNPGGPGGSGVDFVLALAPYLYTDEVRARFDIVGFDPRGIARSTALRCFGTPKQWEGYYTPFAFPMTLDEAAVWEAADRYLDAACDQRAARIIDHMSTADVARDLDVLRQAVGDDGLSYVGYSYGSYLGVTYASLFPGRVRALVVDGVIDPIAWSTGVGHEADTLPFSTRLRSDAGAQATLEEFFRLCDAGGYPSCPFAPNAGTRYADLAARLRAQPMMVTLPNGVTRVYNYSQFISSSLGAMYDSYSWPAFARFLAAVESSATPVELGARLQELWKAVGLITKRGEPQYPNYIEGFPAVSCADSDNPTSYDAWWAAAHLYPTYFAPLWTYASSSCAAWPGTQNDRYPGPFTSWTSNPVLVVNTLFDPATRYEGALQVRSLLPNSRLLKVHGWGHTTLFYSADADAAVSGYLLSGTPPPDGTMFDQDYVPFQAMAAAPAAPAASGLSSKQEKRQHVTVPAMPDLLKKAVR